MVARNETGRLALNLNIVLIIKFWIHLESLPENTTSFPGPFPCQGKGPGNEVARKQYCQTMLNKSAYDPKNMSFKTIHSFKRLFKVEQNGVFLFVMSFFVPEIFKLSYYANLVTDDVIGCGSTEVWHIIKNIPANNEAMLLKHLAGVLHVTKYTKWYTFWCYYGNMLGSSLLPLRN